LHSYNEKYRERCDPPLTDIKTWSEVKYRRV